MNAVLGSLAIAALSLSMSHGVHAQATSQPIESGPPVAPTGSIPLWNGHDLTGWTTYLKAGATAPPDFWSARDGVLHLAGRPSGYLRTDKAFANYHLHLEWRWPAPAKSGTNNSGIFVHVRAPDAIWPYSVQVQVKAGSSGDLIAQHGLTFSPGDPQLIRKKLVASNEKPAGEWNATDICCRGASIEVWVNGLRQNFVDNLPADSGQVALQVEGYPIEFRNLWLQQL